MTPTPRGPAPVSAFIPRRSTDPAATEPNGFWDLRSAAIRHAQDASGEVWTDYNLHDPGVTILEQVCYALTDLVVRTRRPVPELLASPDGRMAFGRLALLAPQRVLPCRASTPADLRRLLLDEVPDLDDVQLRPVRTADAPGEPTGLYRLQVKPAIDLPPDREAAAIREARRAWRAQRTLGEDLDVQVDVVERRLCHLHAHLDLEGSRSPAAIVAEVYARCVLHVADRLRRATVAEWRAQGRRLEDVLTGPLPVNSCLDEAQARAAPRPVLTVGELGRVIEAVEGVREVRALCLHRDGDGDGDGATRLPWRGEGWALSLCAPGRPDFRPTVTVARAGVVVVPDARELVAEYLAIREAATSPRSVRADLDAWIEEEGAAAAPPPGPPAPVTGPAGWTSVQEQFPPVYRLGANRPSRGATPQEHAQRAQLQGYLALFDQLMANGVAQLDHLHELFSLRSRGPTTWWNTLDDATVADIGSLYTVDPGTLAQRILARHDDPVGRRHRVLDALLAMYGQTFTQGALRRSFVHLRGDELETRLLDNKRDFLAQIEVLTRDRGSGFDPGRPHWDVPDNTSGLQRMLGLLLGFRRCTARSLLGRLSARRITLTESPAGGAVGMAVEPPAGVIDRMRPLPLPLPLAAAADPGDADGVREGALPAWLTAAGPTVWPAALPACGADRGRYRLVPVTGTGSVGLALQADDEGRRWWHLAGPFRREAEAVQVADAIRARLLALCDDAEGVHVVEHVLLRRRSDAGHGMGALPAGCRPLRVSLLFADWTPRARDPAFRALAAETAAICSPAHVHPVCLWVGQGEMAEVEARWTAWLDALRAHETATEDARRGRLAAEVDRASDAVAWILRQLAAGPAAASGG